MAVRSKMWLLTASWDTRVSGYPSRGQRLLVPSQDLRDSPVTGLGVTTAGQPRAAEPDQ